MIGSTVLVDVLCDFLPAHLDQLLAHAEGVCVCHGALDAIDFLVNEATEKFDLPKFKSTFNRAGANINLRQASSKLAFARGPSVPWSKSGIVLSTSIRQDAHQSFWI